MIIRTAVSGHDIHQSLAQAGITAGYYPSSMRTLTVKVPAELDEAITAVARRLGTTRSNVVRTALRQIANQPELSMADLVGDLAGVVEGPTDLATNPAHMAGFGR